MSRIGRREIRRLRTTARIALFFGVICAGIAGYTALHSQWTRFTFACLGVLAGTGSYLHGTHNADLYERRQV